MDNVPTRRSPTFETTCNDMQNFWSKDLPSDSWYLCAAATCIASHKPALVRDLYLTLAKTAPTEDNTAQPQVSVRLKDTFMKLWTITGIPPVVTAVTSLAAAEQGVQTDAHKSTPREQQAKSHYHPKQLDQAVENQGYSFMQDIYKHNLDPIMSTWGDHQADFEWLEKRVIYGLFLSDHSILSPIETNIVTLSAMLCQPLKPPALWHIRGLRRLGVSKEAADSVIKAAGICARYCGKNTDDWISVDDVEDEV